MGWILLDAVAMVMWLVCGGLWTSTAMSRAARGAKWGGAAAAAVVSFVLAAGYLGCLAVRAIT